MLRFYLQSLAIINVPEHPRMSHNVFGPCPISGNFFSITSVASERLSLVLPVHMHLSFNPVLQQRSLISTFARPLISHMKFCLLPTCQQFYGTYLSFEFRQLKLQFKRKNVSHIIYIIFFQPDEILPTSLFHIYNVIATIDKEASRDTSKNNSIASN